jgi:L-asparagine transporter-like permease
MDPDFCNILPATRRRRSECWSAAPPDHSLPSTKFFMRQDVFTLLASSTGAISLFIYMLMAFAEIRQRRRSEAAAVAIGGVLVLLALMPEQRTALTLSMLTVVLVFGALWVHRTRKASPPTIAITLE